ncbi:MAG: isoleucine--tRNA ligase, partial [Microcoleus sp. CAN_BIN18]|nr:isoleucine--tRNA ligase [Microcoleus sp. CAN_BIN18]
VLDTINQVPMLGELFEVIGFLFTLWFVFRNLLFAENRQEIAAQVELLKLDVAGNAEAIVFPERQPIVMEVPEKVLVELQPIAQMATATAEMAIVKAPEMPKAKSITLDKQSEILANITLMPDSAKASNAVDELRYLFITSEVELVESNVVIAGLPYSYESPELAIGVVKVGGHKCDRCWNYSTHVGESIEHPLICERCVSAVDGKF